MFASDSKVGLLVAKVATRLHTDRRLEAGQLAGDWLGVEVSDDARAVEVLTILLQWLLANDGYEEAAAMLWSPSLFTTEPESAKRVWKAFTDHNFILLMGAASMSKSYSMGVRLMLEWIRDPEFTSVRVPSGGQPFHASGHAAPRSLAPAGR
jgi:hypothetical protein